MLSSLRHSSNNRDLSVRVDDQVLDSNAFAELPNLERLELFGRGVAKDLVVTHRGLKSLTIKEWNECLKVVLDCPHLEDLKIVAKSFADSWEEIIDSSCSKLKKIHVIWDLDGGSCEADDPFEFTRRV